MWAGLTAVAALAVAAYAWFRRDGDSAPSRAAPAPASAGALPGVDAPMRYDPYLLRRLDACGVTAEDLTIANRWTASFVGDVLPLRARLDQMRVVLPMRLWPPSAQRVWCAFGPGPLPGVPEALPNPVQDEHRHGRQYYG